MKRDPEIEKDYMKLEDFPESERKEAREEFLLFLEHIGKTHGKSFWLEG